MDNKDINVKDNKYTEEEEKDLFDKLKKIGKLFGLELKIRVTSKMNRSSADVEDGNKINIATFWDDFEYGLTKKRLMELMRDNIDDYHKELDESDYKEIPLLIYVFMHELSHLLTMNMFDLEIYNSSIFRFKNDVVLYRQHPYEKLADNLGYELLYQNYNSIIKILLGKRIRIDNRRIKKNMEISKNFKDKYVGEYASKHQSGNIGYTLNF